MIEVLCIGHAAFDVVLPMDQFPAENKKYALDVKLESGGGPAANASFLLSGWGVGTAFMGQVGDDVYGHTLIRELESGGVDISLLRISKSVPTPYSTILVNTRNGSRTILNFRQKPEPFEIPVKQMSNFSPRVLLFDGHEAEASFEALKLFPGAISILDAGSVRENTLSLAKLVDYLITSESFALSFCDIASFDSKNAVLCLKKLNAAGKGRVVVTLGERGLFYWDAGQVVHLPAYPVNSVDTTGAGDFFHGAFAYGLLQGYSFEKNLHFSAAAAALSVRKLGGRPSIPSLQEVLSYTEQNQTGP
jgi:sulfofructose kinase